MHTNIPKKKIKWKQADMVLSVSRQLSKWTWFNKTQSWIDSGHDPEKTLSWMNTIQNPSGHNPQWTQSQMNIIPNGYDPKQTQFWIDTIPNGHNLEPKWTWSQMDTILNGHLHPYSSLDAL